MRIGTVISRIGGVDGVALETEKWLEVLQRRGNDLFLLAGEIQNDFRLNACDEVQPMLSFFSSECLMEQEEAFFHPLKTPISLLEVIERNSNLIAAAIIHWIKKYQLEVLVVQNSTALPSHISLGVALKKVIHKTQIITIAHNHDFSWERGARYISPHASVNQLIKNTFPVLGNNVIQVVINEYSKRLFKKNFDIQAIKVPNIMDFKTPFAKISPRRHNQLFRFLGIKETDILLFQITRIVKRKRIETAIELVARLKNPAVKLVVAGDARDDYAEGYMNTLRKLVEKLKLQNQIILAPRVFKRKLFERKEYLNLAVDNVFSIAEAYASANAITYFSDYEGFGNAFIEAVLARIPIFVNAYKPVFEEDIGCKGFKTVKIFDNNLTPAAIAEVKEILFNKAFAEKITQYNFEIGKKYFSYEVLNRKFNKIFTIIEKMPPT